MSSEYRVVSGYIRGYMQTDGVKDGRVSDFNKNITKGQGIEVLPPEVKRRQIQASQDVSWYQS